MVFKRPLKNWPFLKTASETDGLMELAFAVLKAAE